MGDCQYELCAEATWEDGLLTYSIGITHETPVAEYAVRIEVSFFTHDERGDVCGSESGHQVTSESIACTVCYIPWCVGDNILP